MVFVQVFFDLCATALRSAALVVYPVHVILLTDSSRRRQ